MDSTCACIPESQRQLHATSEALAVVVAAPFLFWLSANPRLPPWARVTAAVMGAGTLLVDGYLLTRMVRKA
jgi:hypothetical protein